MKSIGNAKHVTGLSPVITYKQMDFNNSTESNRSLRNKNHYPQPIQQIASISTTQPSYRNIAAASKRYILDGFLLLEATNMSFPDDGRQAMLSGRGFTGVEDADLAFFTGLLYLDVSENFLELHVFGVLPRLQELRLACNRISSIESLEGFQKLQTLDLSYNMLTIASVAALTVLPSLKELDLCGNNLEDLPEDICDFPCLEKLLLEHNRIDNNDIFNVLCDVPKLRVLSLAYNFLTAIPEESCRDEDCFRLLENLDLSFNYFAKEQHLTPIVRILRLDKLMLYGNPVLGPTGEDPLFTYIPDLEEWAVGAREGLSSRSLEIVTEAPKKKKGVNRSQGGGLGRQATYKDFTMAKVEAVPIFSQNREGFGAPSKTLFTQALELARKERLDKTSIVPDTTFLTSGANTAYIPPSSPTASRQARSSRLPDRFQSSFPDGFFADSTALQEDGDDLPGNIMSRGFLGGGSLIKPAMPLATALRALRFALQHPLSDADHIPQSSLAPVTDYTRPNKIVQIRQLPKRTLMNSTLASPATTTAQDSRHQNRIAARRTMDQLGDVLNDLNANTEDLVRSSVARGPDSVMVKGLMKPNTGIRKLVKMVNKVVSDTDT